MSMFLYYFLNLPRNNFLEQKHFACQILQRFQTSKRVYVFQNALRSSEIEVNQTDHRHHRNITIVFP